MAEHGAAVAPCRRLISSERPEDWRNRRPRDDLWKPTFAGRSVPRTTRFFIAWRLVAPTCWSVAPVPPAAGRRGAKRTAGCNIEPPVGAAKTGSSTGSRLKSRTLRICSSTCRRSDTARTTIQTLSSPAPDRLSFRTSPKRRTQSAAFPGRTGKTAELSPSTCCWTSERTDRVLRIGAGHCDGLRGHRVPDPVSLPGSPPRRVRCGAARGGRKLRMAADRARYPPACRSIRSSATSQLTSRVSVLSVLPA